ncbi:hypothetical protein [Streptomyces sp. WAC05950]|uniref:hypothetical protein n=1 Tax=Streptomyces sp. WAC05950 TaxID=2487419 RepID=UPI0021AEC618|nr:hypothetical protein [Streptomyces sp. WAC05950]
MPDPYAASRTAGERIEALYGRPVAELAADAVPDSMRYALLNSFDALQYADRAVTFHAEQLHRLTHPDRAIESVDVGHISDGTRRLAHAVTVRDSHAQVLGDVLNSLVRVPDATSPASAEPQALAVSPAPPPAAPTEPARSR